MLVPFPSSCFSLIWDCHLFLYSLSHPPRYLPQPCSGSHRLNYVLRTNRTVSVQILWMNVCRGVKYAELGAIQSRYSSVAHLLFHLPHWLVDMSHLPGGNPEHFFFFFALDIWGTKLHSYFSYKNSLVFFPTISSIMCTWFSNGPFSTVD